MNIVILSGCCSNRECTMLLFEYMPNRNLDDLLHGKNKGENVFADWVTRYKIALGVSQGICYLHHDCNPMIIHRDLKPSNILLDGSVPMATLHQNMLIHYKSMRRVIYTAME